MISCARNRIPKLASMLSILQRLSFLTVLTCASLQGAVVINEIMYHPSSHLADEEWIELHNTDGVSVSLANWQFTKGVSYTFPAGTSIPAGGYLVVAANGSAFAAKYPLVPNYRAGWIGQLSNNAEKITLKDQNGTIQDEVEYADDGDWAERLREDPPDLGHRGWFWKSEADGYGKSLELMRAASDNNVAQNWKASLSADGTPGAINSTAAADLAPIILDTRHFPLIPKSTDVVTATARIIDELVNGVTATLFYREDGVTAWTSTPLLDDGAHGDGVSGDRIYGAQIPAHADGKIVEFYVQAIDSGARTRIWPLPAVNTIDPSPHRTCNCLYQVDNTVYSGASPLYRLIIKAADRAELTAINDAASPADDQSHARYNSTFITLDGSSTELRYQCGTRNRGHGSANHQPANFNVSIPAATNWNGRTSLDFNGYYTYVQLLGSALARKGNLGAPESRPVQLRVNRIDPTQVVVGSNQGAANDFGRSFGFYVCNEAKDSSFAEHHFPQDSGGNLYSVRRTSGTQPYQEGDLEYMPPAIGQTPADPYRVCYFKETNTAEDDWTDLIAVTAALAKGHSASLTSITWDADYVPAVSAVIDVNQFMRWFAVEAFFNNGESNLTNGIGDDYSLYMGKTDPRARLIPHDLDTILGAGDAAPPVNTSIFAMAQSFADGGPTALNAFMKHPQFAPIYYAELKALMDGPFSAANFNALADQTLSGLVSQTIINDRKASFAARYAYIQSQIPLSISGITTNLASQNGYPRATSASCQISGFANAIETRSVKVKGVPANWTAWTASWSAPAVALTPGINRILIQAFDGAGVELERKTFDVWYDDLTTTAASGGINSNQTWTAASGPYQLNGTVTINNGATLTIQPGTSVYFGTGMELIVAPGGRLIANGTESQPIRFTSAPAVTRAIWRGINVQGTLPLPAPTQISHAYFDYNADQVTGDIAIRCYDNANVVLEHLAFGATGWPYIWLDNTSFLVSNCVFPSGTRSFELIHGSGPIPAGGRGIIRDCFFGKPMSVWPSGSFNDTIDFTGGNRPGPIIQILNNVFVGSDDDILDIDGTDAWIEGNIFMGVHRNHSPDSASAISGGYNGDFGALETSEMTIVGNLFYDLDQAVTAKEGNFYTFLNNTVVKQTKAGGEESSTAVINVGEEEEAIPKGLGVYAEGNIIHSAEALVRHYDPAHSSITFNNNILPFAWSGPGSGNTVADPLLNDVSNIPVPTEFDFRTLAPKIRQMFGLQAASPAKGTGPNGTDKGGIRQLGVSLSGAPIGTTNQTGATITVGTRMTGFGIPSSANTYPSGSGWTHYKYRLNGGAWSSEMPISTPITLSALNNGEYYVEAVGKNDAGFYQDHADYGANATISRTATWAVNNGYVPPPAQAVVRINEVLASNTQISVGGVFPDIIELHNAGTVAANLSGWGLTDNSSLPYKYTFPAGTTLAPGAYRTIYASSDSAVPQPRTGFGLKREGDTLTLTKSSAAGGGVADSIPFGNQLADASIGRVSDASWSLCAPTFGAVNQPVQTGSLSGVKINEWLADAGVLESNDFIELYNPSSKPVNIGGCYLTDNPPGYPDRNLLRPLTFIAPGGYVVFQADDNASDGPAHLNFKLSPLQGEIGFLSPALQIIDSIIYGPQSTDISQGRTPNGSATSAFFNQLSPGGPNPILSTGGVQTLNLIPANHVWKFHANTAAPPNDSAGRAFTDPLYDDTGWVSGAGVLYIESANFPVNGDGFAKTTLLPPGTAPYQTNYFRTHFNFSGPVSGTTLTAKIMCDDGCVVHLNGTEILPTTGTRIRMTNATPTYATLATGSSPEVTIETYQFTNSNLLVGDNVLTVSVHQSTDASSDIIWGMKLDATVPTGSPVVLNEIFPANMGYQNPDGSFHGWIELYNPSGSSVSLADYSLSNEPDQPRKYVFGAGVSIPASGFLVIQCNSLSAASATNTGFGLSSTSDHIYLFRPLAQSGTLSDSIVYGRQLVDYSVGRIPSGSGSWTLNIPTRNTLNSVAAVAATSNIKINEWAANAGPTWFELYNTATQPVALGGSFLTDQLIDKTKYLIPPLTYIGGSGMTRWQVWTADNDGGNTEGHVNFSLNIAGEALGIFTSSGAQIDAISFGAQNPGQSGGRYIDGSSSILSIMPPTPGTANIPPASDTDFDGIPNNWETANGLNPNSNDASLDPDKDGLNNLQEYMAGTDPQHPGSRLAAAITDDTIPGQFAIHFTAVAGKTYSVRYKTALTDPTWTALAHIPASGSTLPMTVTDTPPLGAGKRFYQVVTPSQQ